MAEKELCPACGEGHLAVRHVDTVTEYKGQQGTISLAVAECDACGSELAGDEESRANKRAVLAFRKTVDGLMSGVEIRALREKYGITQAQAAKLFGGGPVAFSKYENDDVAHSEAMDGLLRLAQKNDDAFWDLVEIKGLTAELPTRPVKKAHVLAQVLHVVLTIRDELQPGMQFVHRVNFPVQKTISTQGFQVH
jgi:HTH-type transcriptional regulator/antitoxin MqsA